MNRLLECFRLDLHAERMRNDFWYFTERAFLSKLPRRVPARHQRIVCEAVQQLADGEGDEILIVLMPPGGAKSLICARALPAWILGREPNARILAITNTQPLVESHGRAIRDTLQSKSYQNVFGVTVSANNSAASAFTTTSGGEFFGVGSAGAALGRRAEWVTIDDPISGIEEAMSMSQMVKLHDAWQNNILTRAVPGTKIVLIQQRLSVNDLAGYIMANPVKGGFKIRVIRMPMLCDDPKNDPLGRAEGDPLWPEYWSPAMLAQAQADPLKWRTLYQQKPAQADSEWFSPEDIQTTPTPSFVEVQNRDKWRILIGCDIAYTEGAGDATVFAVVAFEKATGAMHVMDLYREHRGDARTVEDLLDWIDKWKPDWIGMDADLATRGYVGHLKVRAVQRGTALSRLSLLPLKAASGSGKQQRAVPLKLKSKAGLLHVDRSQPWATVLLRELTMFPNATGAGVDDCVDALGLCARHVSNMIVSKSDPTTEKPHDPRGSFYSATFDELWTAHELGSRGHRRI